LHQQLAAIVDDLQAARERLCALREALPLPAWQQRPGPGRWSPAECISHLNLTSEALLPLIREGIDQARTRGPVSLRYHRGLLGWFVWRIVTPSGGVSIDTIPEFEPVGSPVPGALIADFDRLQEQMIECVDRSKGLPIDRVTLVSPFHGRLRYNLYAALTLVPRHQHRHLLQAERAAPGWQGAKSERIGHK
jgi:hypothetical protein